MMRSNIAFKFQSIATLLCMAAWSLPTVAQDGPAPVLRIEPVFPQIAAMAGSSATCMMTFDVLNDGTTSDVRACCETTVPSVAQDSFGTAMADAFALTSEQAVIGWRFTTADGAPTDVQFPDAQTELVFRLTEDGAAPRGERKDAFSSGCSGGVIS